MSKCIQCNSKKGFGVCVAEMDAQESMGGTITCIEAEDCDFDIDTILKECPLAQKAGGVNG